jgi:internalin A
MKKVFALLTISIFLYQMLPVSADSPQAKTKSFTQWCQQKSAVPAITQHTIDLLLKQAGTQDCQLADAKLKSLTSLTFEQQNISNLWRI